MIEQFPPVLLLMQHCVADLLLNQHCGHYLLIEKGRFSWYYVITARETKTNNKTKEEKAMIATIVAGAVAGGLGLGLGYLGIYLFTKIG